MQRVAETQINASFLDRFLVVLIALVIGIAFYALVLGLRAQMPQISHALAGEVGKYLPTFKILPQK